MPTFTRNLKGTGLLMLILASSIGCSGNSPSTGPTDAGPADSPLAADQFAEATFDALCDAVMHCDQPNAIPVSFPNKATCLEYFSLQTSTTASTFDTPAAIEASIAAGKIQYDGVKAKACLAALAAEGCAVFASNEDPLLAIPACHEALVGKVPQGGGCIAHAACATGTFCSQASTEQSCAGTCQPRGSGNCTSDNHCPSGQRCLFGGDGHHCVTPSTVNTECTMDQECANGLYCEYGDDGATCQPLPTAGETCSGTCAPGLICAVGHRPPGTCTAIPTHDGDACVSGSCGDGLWCNYNEGNDGTCRPVVGENHACTGMDCAAGLVCIENNGSSTCLRQPGLGDSCVNDNHCNPQRTLTSCDATSKKCALLPGAGKPCVQSSQFGSDVFLCNPLEAYCDEQAATKTCKAFKVAGAACVSDFECGGDAVGGYCVESHCQRTDVTVCQP